MNCDLSKCTGPHHPESGRLDGCWVNAAREWLAVVGVGVAVAGCASLGIDTDEVASRCMVDADCGPALRCFDTRICIAIQATAERVAVRLTPPKETGKLVEHFEVNVGAQSQSEPVALMLTEPAVVHVRYFSKLAVQGTLVATAPSDVNGSVLRYDAKGYFDAKTKTLDGYELRVQPGKTYDLVFRPDADDKVPPHYSKITVGASIDPWLIILTEDSKLLKIRGRLVAAGKPLVGLRVHLSNDEGQLTSTRSHTDINGEFVLRVDPSATAGRLSFAPADPALPLPQGRMTKPIEIKKIALQVDPKPFELGDMDVGEIPPAVQATLTVQDEVGKPTGGALVRIQRKLSSATNDLQAFIEVHGNTDKAGVFTAAMPIGMAKVAVVPVAAAHAARWTGNLNLQGSAHAITCAVRRSVVGQVVDYAGRPLRQAKVWLRRVAQADGPTEDFAGVTALGDVPLETTTNSDGKFSLPADSGGWWLWVQPKATDQLPRLLASKVDVSTAIDTPIKVTVPAPLLLVGKVVTVQGAVVTNAAIDILALQGTPVPLRSTSGGGAKGAPSAGAGVLADSHLLGSALTDSKGVFEVLLAPPQ